MHHLSHTGIVYNCIVLLCIAWPYLKMFINEAAPNFSLAGRRVFNYGLLPWRIEFQASWPSVSGGAVGTTCAAEIYHVGQPNSVEAFRKSWSWWISEGWWRVGIVNVAKRDGFKMVWFRVAHSTFLPFKIKPKKGTALQKCGARCNQTRVDACRCQQMKALDSRLVFVRMIAYNLNGLCHGFQSLNRQGLQLVKARLSKCPQKSVQSSRKHRFCMFIKWTKLTWSYWFYSSKDSAFKSDPW